MNLREHLSEIMACAEARDWVGSRTAAEAWEQCTRADWLLWWAAKTNRNNRQKVVYAVCQCARTALRNVPDAEKRPRLAIEAVEVWCANPTEAHRRVAAAYAAYAAYAAAASSAVASSAAAYAAVASSAAAYAAAYSSSAAAYYAAYSSSAAASAASAAYYAKAAKAANAANVATAAHMDMCCLIRGILVCPWGGEEKD